MSDNPGLLKQIEDDLLVGKPLPDLLRKTVLFGGRTGSADLRDWAARELKGFAGVAPEQMPDHRLIPALMFMDSISARGQVLHQPLPPRLLPEFAKELDADFPVKQGVGELEAWVTRGEAIQISVPGGDIVGRELARRSSDSTLQVYAVYWLIDPVSITGVLDRVRTSLTELIGELTSLTPDDSSPSPEHVSQAVNLVINGNGHRVSVSTTHRTGSAGVEEPGWWTRSRRIGATLVGAASIISAVVAIMVL